MKRKRGLQILSNISSDRNTSIVVLIQQFEHSKIGPTMDSNGASQVKGCEALVRQHFDPTAEEPNATQAEFHTLL